MRTVGRLGAIEEGSAALHNDALIHAGYELERHIGLRSVIEKVLDDAGKLGHESVEGGRLGY